MPFKKRNYKAFENYLVAKYERLAGVLRTRSYPYVMIIDPSSICQLRCPGCPTGIDNELRRAKRLDETRRPLSLLARGILDSILNECGDVLFACHFFNWGEPLLNEDLPEYIASASRRDIYTKVDTNFSLKCSDELLEELLLSGLDELAVSADGFSQRTYEQYRVGGRFDLVMENLERLIETRGRLGRDTKITWNFLLYSFNEHEAEDIAAFCKQRNINFLARDAIINTRTHADWLPTYRREGKPNPYRVRRPPSDFATPAGLLPLYPGRPTGRTCAWHYSYTSVNADGSVLPCCKLFDQKHDFGRVTATPGSFGKLWNNQNFQTVRGDFPAGKETKTTGPTTVCTQCNATEAFRDHYSLLDREIMLRYWTHHEDPGVRQLDKFYTLLQRSPAEFAAAYAARYEEQATLQAV